MKTLLSRYTVLRELAQSGVSSVYLARLDGPDGFSRTVVIRRLRVNADDARKARLFRAEAMLAAQLNHPNVAHVYDFVEEAGDCFIVMEHIDGPSLRTLLQRARAANHPLSVAHSLKIGSWICEGLSYAHSLKHERTGEPLWVVHREITPENVLVTRTGVVKIIDFGFAKAITQLRRTQRGETRTLAYLSPEQLTDHALDGRADVFSLGVVLFELLTGVQPFLRDDPSATLNAVANQELPAIASLRPDAPSALDAILAKATAKKRNERYPSAIALQQALEFELAQLVPNFTSARLRELVHTVAPAAPEKEPNASAGTDALAPARTNEGPRQPPPVMVAAVGTSQAESAPPPLPARPAQAEQTAPPPPVPAAFATPHPDEAPSPRAHQALPDVPAPPSEQAPPPPAHEAPPDVPAPPSEQAPPPRAHQALPEMPAPRLEQAPPPPAHEALPEAPAARLEQAPPPPAHEALPEAPAARLEQAPPPPAPDGQPGTGAAPAPRKTAGSPPVPHAPPRRSGAPLAIFLGLAVLGAGGWWAVQTYELRAGPQEPGPIVAAREPRGIETPPPLPQVAPSLDAGAAAQAELPDAGPQGEEAAAAGEIAAAPLADAGVSAVPPIADSGQLAAAAVADAGAIAVATGAGAGAAEKVEAQPTEPAPAAPARAGGSGVAVKIKSAPEATVWIDGAHAGATPLQIDLAAGSYKLRFESPDAGLNKSVLLRVPKGETFEREFTFERARLTLEAPEGATVFLGRRKLGNAPLAPIEVYEGTYRIHVVDTKRSLDVTKIIEVKPGEVTARVGME